MKILSILSILFFALMTTANAHNSAVKVLSDSGLSHSIAQVKTIYANQGDHIFYKEVSASKGMLLITDGKVQKFQPGRGNRVVVAVVKNYS